MSDDVEKLRQQLREHGYLTHAIERWFALDPWVSRTFWVELSIVASKAAVLLSAFGIVPMTGVMLFRNHPLTGVETMELTLLYGVAWLAVAFTCVVGLALMLKLRPSLAIDTPRALLGISIAVAAALSASIAGWWYRFDAAPTRAELVIGLALVVVFFVVVTIVVSAALLSFSIHELRRIPAIYQRPRTIPITLGAAILVAGLFLPSYAAQEKRTAFTPPQVVISPSSRRMVLLAVDGLSYEILRSRTELTRSFSTVVSTVAIPAESTAEQWASVGTGVTTAAHGVRAIEGIRFRGGAHLIQTLSHADFVLHEVAPAMAIVRRQPLPPTVRRRDYVWEIFASRSVTAVAVNWWTTESAKNGALDSIGQEAIFAAARSRGDATVAAVAIEEAAVRRLLLGIDRDHPLFATAYLPSLDVVLNRLPADATSRIAASVRLLDGIANAITSLRGRGYDLVVIGLPGDRQGGRGVVASTIPLTVTAATPLDIAPTLCALFGFPASEEMPGRSLVTTTQPRIATYGTHAASAAPPRVDQEYYENLKSLGYIR